MYSVKNTTCRCHPETCCCPDYEILKTAGSVVFTVARGNDLLDLETLVVAANTVDELESQLAEAKKDQARYCYAVENMLILSEEDGMFLVEKEAADKLIDAAIASIQEGK
jgi:hypothetical protein